MCDGVPIRNQFLAATSVAAGTLGSVAALGLAADGSSTGLLAAVPVGLASAWATVSTWRRASGPAPVLLPVRVERPARRTARR